MIVGDGIMLFLQCGFGMCGILEDRFIVAEHTGRAIYWYTLYVELLL